MLRTLVRSFSDRTVRFASFASTSLCLAGAKSTGLDEPAGICDSAAAWIARNLRRFRESQAAMLSCCWKQGSSAWCWPLVAVFCWLTPDARRCSPSGRRTRHRPRRSPVGQTTSARRDRRANSWASIRGLARSNGMSGSTSGHPGCLGKRTGKPRVSRCRVPARSECSMGKLPFAVMIQIEPKTTVPSCFSRREP